MTIDLNYDQSQAVRRGEAVRLIAQDLGEVVVLQASAYEEALAEEREKAGWARLSKKAADRWGRENPFES